MVKHYLILFSLIYSINSNSINQQNCSVCEFDEYFKPSNGYGCFQKSDNETICTCPDFLWTINQPCRICNRKGICGPQTVKCQETSVVSPTKNKPYFVCHCPSNSLHIGEKCPEDTSSNTTAAFISTTTSVPNPTTTSTKQSTTSNMETVTKCNSSLHLFVEPILIILLNLVYFVNK